MAFNYGGWEDYSRAGGPTTPAPPSNNWWDKLAAGAGKFVNSDALPVVLGQAAQAIMGGSQEGRESWQSGLGGVASGLAQSNIAAKAAKRQANERSQISGMLTKLLSGGLNFTPNGKPGISSANFKVGGQDTSDKLIIEGDGLLGESRKDNLYTIDNPQSEVYQGTQPQGTQNQGSPTAQPQASPPKPAGNVRPSAPPMAPQMGSQLPFTLAQAVTGSGGGSGDLFGLTPEQIQGISRTDILGQEMLGRSSRDIYSNLSNQAYTDYMAQKPALEAYKTAADTQIAQREQQLKAQRQIAQNAKDWASVDKIDAELKMLGPEFRKLNRQRLALDQRLADLTAKRTAAEARRDYAGVSKIDQELRLEMQKAVRDAEVEIIGGFNSKGEKVVPGDVSDAMLDSYNSMSDSNTYYVRDNEKAMAVTLPPGFKAEDMFVTLRENPMLTVDDVIKLLTK